jgi:hypothetical protein
MDAFRLTKCDGSRIRVTVKSRDFDAAVMVVGPRSDQPLFNDDDDDADHATDAALEFTCEKDVTYKVFAGALLGDTGSA